MSGRWKRILALGAAVVLCLIAAAQMGSLFHWKVTCTPAAFAESSRRLSNPDRGFYYIYGYRITDEPVDYATDLRDRTREDDATRLGMMQINLREYRTGAISEEGLSNVRQLFAAMADSDKKWIVRFLYDWNGENEQYEPEFIGAGEQHIIKQLKKTKTPVILIINKVDTVEREKILEYIDAYRKVFDFAEIVPASALREQNLDTVVDVIFKYLPYGPMFYDEETVTDQPERAIVAEIIREKALHALDDEIPHGIAVYIDRMKERRGQNIIDIDATIVCERDSHKGIIIGKGGSMLKKIGSNARYEMERLLDTQVNLKLWVKVRKDWRDSELMMKNFGYNKDDI